MNYKVGDKLKAIDSCKPFDLIKNKIYIIDHIDNDGLFRLKETGTYFNKYTIRIYFIRPLEGTFSWEGLE